MTDLQGASAELDDEKDEAEENFKDLLRQLPGRREFDHQHMRGKFGGAVHWIKEFFGMNPHLRNHSRFYRGLDYWMDVAFGKIKIDLPEKEFHSRDKHHDGPPERGHGPPDFPIRKFIKAAKRVQKANQKLIAFERGFISKGGIKDRTWYKHLGVAPGLWLGKF